jgi:hypothetical protein
MRLNLVFIARLNEHALRLTGVVFRQIQIFERKGNCRDGITANQYMLPCLSGIRPVETTKLPIRIADNVVEDKRELDTTSRFVQLVGVSFDKLKKEQLTFAKGRIPGKCIDGE